MKRTKTELRFFTVPQWKREEQYLRLQHKNGWKFIYVSGLGCYHFEECRPEDVVYQLDYNPHVNKVEYVRMFGDCGWEHIQDFWGYSYFRKPLSEMNGDEEIFCDYASKLDMMRRVFKGRILPMLAYFLLFLLPNLCLQGYLFTSFPSEYTGVMFGILGLLIAVMMLYTVLLTWFGIQYWAYSRAVHRWR